MFFLAVLGVAVSHIRPVKTLSDASGDSSIFVFTLMLVWDRVFALSLYMEVYFQGVGQRQLKSAAFRDACLHSVTLPFYIAATVVAALELFRKGAGAGDRLLAELAEETKSDYATGYASSTSGTTDTPIYLCLFGYITGIVIHGINIIFWMPGGGRHKEL
jgi:hypothetical protein